MAPYSYPSPQYPVFPAPNKKPGLVDMKTALEAFNNQSDRPSDVAEIVFAEDYDLGQAVITYLKKYGLDLLPSEVTPDSFKDSLIPQQCGTVSFGGGDRDPLYGYRLVLTVAVIAAAARDNDNAKYAIMFDDLWDWARYVPYTDSLVQEDSAYLGFVKEQNIKAIVDEFKRIGDPTFEYKVQIDTNVNTPDDRYKYGIAITGMVPQLVANPQTRTFSATGSSVPFIVAFHISAVMAEEFVQSGIPISHAPYQKYAIGTLTNRTEALRYFITQKQDPSLDNLYYTVQTVYRNPFNSGNCKYDKKRKVYLPRSKKTPLIDIGSPPHALLDGDPEIRQIPFPEYIGLLKNKSLTSLVQQFALQTRKEDFSAMDAKKYYGAALEVVKKVNKLQKLDRKENRVLVEKTLKRKAYAILDAKTVLDLSDANLQGRFDYNKKFYVAVLSGNTNPNEGRTIDPVAVFELQTSIAGVPAGGPGTQISTPQELKAVVQRLPLAAYIDQQTKIVKGSKFAENLYQIFQEYDGKPIAANINNPYTATETQWPFLLYPADMLAPKPLSVKQLAQEAFYPITPRAMTLDGFSRRWKRANVKPTYRHHLIRLGGIYGYPNFLHQI